MVQGKGVPASHRENSRHDEDDQRDEREEVL